MSGWSEDLFFGDHQKICLKTVGRWSENLFFFEITKKFAQKPWVAEVKTFVFFCGDHRKICAKTTQRPDFFFVYSLVHLEHCGCPGSLFEKYGNLRFNPLKNKNNKSLTMA